MCDTSWPQWHLPRRPREKNEQAFVYTLRQIKVKWRNCESFSTYLHLLYVIHFQALRKTKSFWQSVFEISIATVYKGSLILLSPLCHTVGWNDYLLIFLTKMSYFTSQEVDNPVQIIKKEKLNCQDFKLFCKTQSLLLKLYSLKIKSRLKLLICDFYKYRLVTKWGCYSYFKLLIMLQISIMLFDLC